MLPVPGKDLSGVIAYRDIHDTNAMIAAAEQHTHAVVIGGGLLGLEAANGLKMRGMQVSVVHLPGWLMEEQLDPVVEAGKLGPADQEVLNLLPKNRPVVAVINKSDRLKDKAEEWPVSWSRSVELLPSPTSVRSAPSAASGWMNS